MNPVPNKLKKRVGTNYVIKRALVAWGDISSNSDEPMHQDQRYFHDGNKG